MVIKLVQLKKTMEYFGSDNDNIKLVQLKKLLRRLDFLTRLSEWANKQLRNFCTAKISVRRWHSIKE